jgi:hypothetical protein
MFLWVRLKTIDGKFLRVVFQPPISSKLLSQINFKSIPLCVIQTGLNGK